MLGRSLRRGESTQWTGHALLDNVSVMTSEGRLLPAKPGDPLHSPFGVHDAVLRR